MAAMLAQKEQDTGLPRGMAHVLAYGESRFNPMAVSPDGKDRGLCQTGKRWEAELVWRYFRYADGTPRTGYDWRNPEHNATIGCAYLADLVRRYNGSMYMGLVAYNWGPGHVARMKRWEDIPKSTRRYVNASLKLLDEWKEGWQGNDRQETV